MAYEEFMLPLDELLQMLPSTVGDPVLEEVVEASEPEVVRAAKPARIVVGADAPLAGLPADVLGDSIHEDDYDEEEEDAPIDPRTPGPTPLKLTPSLLKIR